MLPTYLSLHVWNGHTQVCFTPVPPAPSINPRLGSIIATYSLTDEQRTWTVAALKQAIEFGVLTPYTPPTRAVPWQAARFGLGPEATRDDALRVAAQVAPTATLYAHRLMDVALKWWPKPASHA